MNFRKLFFIIILPAFFVVALAVAIIYRGAFFDVLPTAAQNFLSSAASASGQAFRETFGIGAAEDTASGTVEEIALGNDTSDTDSAAGIFDGDVAANNGSDVSLQGVANEQAQSQAKSQSQSQSIASDVPSQLSDDDDASLINGIITAPAEMQTTIAVAAATTTTGTATVAPSCIFPSSPPAISALSQKIIFNEIAWMGVPSLSAVGAATAGNQEWMELKNNSSQDVSLSGWSLMNASQKMKVTFGADDRIAAGGFLLLLRGSTTLPYAHASELSYSGDLRNAGDDLALFDAACGVSDFVPALASGWPAGNNTTKQTMERDVNKANASGGANGAGWHTSVNAGGTPGAENSVVLPPAQYGVTVVSEGSGGATITSNPAGMSCTATQCAGTFTEKTKITLTEKPAVGMVFDGWSGACSGGGSCSFTITGDTSITAAFHMPIVAVADPIVNTTPSSPPTSLSSDTGDDNNDDADSGSTSTPASAPTPSPSEPSSTSSSTGTKIFIAAVQIAGAASTNDFVKLYNPSSVAVDVGGWKLRKRSQTGADYSLRVIPADMAIGPGQYFVWANSAGGFSASIGADISSTETLAGDNSVALIDVDGNIMDALAWGTGTGQYGEGPPYLDNPAAGQVLTRKMTGDVLVDTGSNANDFTLQQNE